MGSLNTSVSQAEAARFGCGTDAVRQVTLKSESGGFLQLKVLSMTRVTMKSSKCGSVVKLHTQDP